MSSSLSVHLRAVAFGPASVLESISLPSASVGGQGRGGIYEARREEEPCAPRGVGVRVRGHH